MVRSSIPALLVALVSSLFALAGTRGYAASDLQRLNAVREPFEPGSHELQLALGYFISQNYHDIFRPQMNDIDISVRYGWMLYSPTGPGILRGNVEFLSEVFGGGFTKGPADGIVGLTGFFRYNFIQPSARFVPYIQVGGGGAYSDLHESHPQRELGAPLSFNLQAGFGGRFFCTEKCAIFYEFDYRHLSNASLAERNVGLNSGGVWLGASIFF